MGDANYIWDIFLGNESANLKKKKKDKNPRSLSSILHNTVFQSGSLSA